MNSRMNSMQEYKWIRNIVRRKITDNGIQCLVIYEESESVMTWVDTVYTEELVTTELICKHKSLDLLNHDNAIASIPLTDNTNYELYTEFMNKFLLSNQEASTPQWDGRDFYKGWCMRIVWRIICCAKFPDKNYYYLVEWGNWIHFKPTWMDREELFCFINDSKIMKLFDQYWSLLELRSLKLQASSQNECAHITTKVNDIYVDPLDPLDQYMLDYDSDIDNKCAESESVFEDGNHKHKYVTM